MSKNRGPVVEFSHANDCEFAGCPGHRIQEVFDRLTDVYCFEVDGRPEYYFDENTFAAILKAHDASRD